MARSFLAEAKLPKKFWYWALREAVIRMNILPVSINKDDPSDPASLTTPHFEFYGVKPDYQILFPFGAIGAFCCVNNGLYSCSKYDSKCLLGIALGRSEFRNGIIFTTQFLIVFVPLPIILLTKIDTLGKRFLLSITMGG